MYSVVLAGKSEISEAHALANAVSQLDQGLEKRSRLEIRVLDTEENEDGEYVCRVLVMVLKPDDVKLLKDEETREKLLEMIHARYGHNQALLNMTDNSDFLYAVSLSLSAGVFADLFKLLSIEPDLIPDKEQREELQEEVEEQFDHAVYEDIAELPYACETTPHIHDVLGSRRWRMSSRGELEPEPE